MSDPAVAVTPALNEWEPPVDRAPSAAARIGLVAVLLIVTALVILASVKEWVLGSFALALLVIWLVQQGHGVRGSRPADERDARAINVLHGLAADLGMAPARLRVVPSTDSNAAASASLRGPTIWLTDGLVGSYTRTELEAVIAQCLLRLKEGGLRWYALVGAFGGLGAAAAPFVGPGIDARTAAVTRYPPALASAIEKATPRSGRHAGWWFVATGATHMPSDERVAALLNL